MTEGEEAAGHGGCHPEPEKSLGYAVIPSHRNSLETARHPEPLKSLEQARDLCCKDVATVTTVSRKGPSRSCVALGMTEGEEAAGHGGCHPEPEKSLGYAVIPSHRNSLETARHPEPLKSLEQARDLCCKDVATVTTVSRKGPSRSWGALGMTEGAKECFIVP